MQDGIYVVAVVRGRQVHLEGVAVEPGNLERTRLLLQLVAGNALAAWLAAMMEEEADGDNPDD